MVRRILSPTPFRFRGSPTAVEALVSLPHHEVVAWPLLNLRYYFRVQVTGKIMTEKETR